MLVSNGSNVAEMENICPLLLLVRVALSSRKGLSASGRLRNPIQLTTPKVLVQRVTQDPQKPPLMYRYPVLLCTGSRHIFVHMVFVASMFKAIYLMFKVNIQQQNLHC